MNWSLVTGGAKGLGAEICKTLAADGFPVVIHYRNSEKEARELADICRKNGAEAEVIRGDFSSIDSTKAFASRYLEAFPQTKNLINNVGSYFIGSALATSIEQWEQIFQSNLHAPYILIRAFSESIKRSKGSIINMGVAGVYSDRADVYSTAYTCAKTGLWKLTRSLASEFAPHNARINMVSPGYLETSVDLPLDLMKIPMRRAASNSEVANTIAFLLSDKASYITGQNLEIAGGVRL